jgi:hypothetical protein
MFLHLNEGGTTAALSSFAACRGDIEEIDELVVLAGSF